jgi:hypothetical protein
MDNHIQIYEKNTKTLAVYVQGLSDLTIYVPYLTVKRRANDNVVLLSKAGQVSDASTTYTFTLNTTDTSIIAGDYVYDVTLVGSSQTHTIVKDRFTILEGVKY